MSETDDLRERLLRKLLADRGHALPDGPAVPRRAPDAVVPLTSAQRRLSTLDRLGEGSAYLVPAVLRVSGPLDADRLEAALRAVVARHEALRTALLPDRQEVRAAVPVLARHDVTAGELPGAVAAETARPFDLDRPPLLRAALFRLGPDEHVLTVVAHHAVCDDRSLGIVLGDLATAYGGGSLPAPSLGFGDYAVWREGRNPAARVAELEAYWAGALDGAPAALDLPLDRPRPAAPSGRGDSVPCELPAGLTGGVRALARETGCTPYMVLLAGFAAVLARYAGQDDVVIGSPVTDRPVTELDDVVGMFVDTVPLRVDLAGEPTGRELLARVRETCVAGFDAAHLPLDRILELAAPRREPGRHPLFQVMFVLNPAGGPTSLPGVDVAPLGLGSTPARFDLTLVVTDGDALSAQLDFAADLFAPATVRALGAQLGALLGELVADPDRPVADLPLLPAPVEVLPAAATAPPVHELFAARVAAAPDAPAVVDAAGTLSYAELDARSTALAGALAAQGVGAETVVGLAAAASADAITGILAVLKAGGAYLPLDPAHPPERLAALLAEAGAPVLLGALVPGFAGVTLGLDAAGAPGPAVTVHSAQTAYVVFTSGSTGRPKGVAVPHSALTNLAVAFADLHGFGPGTRLLMVPPLSFDASVGDVFPALVSGAALVLHPAPGSVPGPELAAFCAEHGVTAVDTASALWQQWVRDGAAFPGVDTMMVGGEAVPAAAVAAWAALTGGRAALHNHYGPTEGTVCATTYRTVDGSELDGAALPAGRPLPGVRVHVLDGRLRPVPVGVPGEVHLGGVGVARGYLGRPDLTAAAFVPDPYAGSPGGRLYRTGDRARWRPDGELEFLGRVDRQVKLRGHRVELGEVEAAVAGAPGVREAVVVAERDADGAAVRLLAYVVPAGAAPSAADLRAHAARTLPAAVLPGAWTVLPELPLTRHGKVDLAALPAPAPVAGVEEAPRTGTDATLAKLWEEAFELPAVGTVADFFELGGHSLLVPALTARIRSVCGVALPARALFEAPRLADLATAVDRLRAGTAVAATGPDLRAEAVLPADVAATLPPAADGPVLLTGGTGMLGVRLLADLLEHGTGEVLCLVRAPSAGAGAARLRDALAARGRWRDEWAGRVVAVPGDLTSVRFGLSEGDWDALAERAGTVLHSAALINILFPYDRLAPVNVAGTVEVLRLAAARRLKPVHFVSTLGVFFARTFAGQVVTEAAAPADPDGLVSTFAQSKWVADALVRQARERGVPASVHRLARVTGDSRTGESKVDDLFCRELRTWVQLGCAPVTGDALDVVPVDHVAAGIGHLVRTPGARGRDFHHRPSRLLPHDELVAAVREAGHPLDLVDDDEFTRRLVAAVAAGREIAISAFTGLGGLATGADAPILDSTATEAELAAAGILPPPADRTLIRRYLDHLLRAGVLPAPPGGAP